MSEQTRRPPVYLDCNATTPVDARVAALVMQFMTEDYGNASSRTHEFGARAKRAVQTARGQVGNVVAAQPDEVYFTSGATEANNLALLGLAAWAERAARCHVISSAIEHKAILEPLELLRSRGFQVELLAPTSDGTIDPRAVRAALRPETGIVSIMHVNNETGIIQPIEQMGAALEGHPAYFHVDAAQSFGKVEGLSSARIDMISVSGHKVFAPKGVGALIARRRAFERLPLTPLAVGGGQERGIRPGTLPVPLIVGFGLAAELAESERQTRQAACRRFAEELFHGLGPLRPVVNGDRAKLVPHVVNLSFVGIDSEAAIVATKDLIAIANGSACTSHSYQPSHVLSAMALPSERISSALRLSWCHLTPPVAWSDVVARLTPLLSK